MSLNKASRNKGNKRPLKYLGLLTVMSIVVTCYFFPLEVRAEILYDSGGRRDPMIPLVGPDGVVGLVKSKADLTVEGIAYDPKGESLAVINGDMYRLGDTVGDAVIVKIHSNRVVLSQEDEDDRVLWLIGEIIEAGGDDAATDKEGSNE